MAGATCDLSATHRLSLWYTVIAAGAIHAGGRPSGVRGPAERSQWSGVTLLHSFAATWLWPLEELAQSRENRRRSSRFGCAWRKYRPTSKRWIAKS